MYYYSSCLRALIQVGIRKPTLLKPDGNRESFFCRVSSDILFHARFNLDWVDKNVFQLRIWFWSFQIGFRLIRLFKSESNCFFKSLHLNCMKSIHTYILHYDKNNVSCMTGSYFLTEYKSLSILFIYLFFTHI